MVIKYLLCMAFGGHKFTIRILPGFIMSQNDKKTASVPTINITEQSTDQTYTVETGMLPPVLRGKPFYSTNEFVLFPDDVVILSQVSLENRRIFNIAEQELFECVIAFSEEPEKPLQPSDLPILGCLLRILKIERNHDQTKKYTVRCVKRVFINEISLDPESKINRVLISDARETPFPTIGSELFEAQGKMRLIRQMGRQIFEAIPSPVAKDILRILERDNSEAGLICDKLLRSIDIMPKERARGFKLLKVTDRIDFTVSVLTEQLKGVRMMADIAQKVRAEMEKQQRDYFLRQQIKAIKEQLGDPVEPQVDLEELREKIEKLKASDDVKEECRKEYARLAIMMPSTSEYHVSRNRLDVLLDVPWQVYTEDNHDMAHARAILDENHFGLKEVKERLLEFLAVRALKPDLKAPIICLAGPPGVGKTSLGKSVARALGRTFHRLSLGGVHDESEIRGHRRTYIGSMPGRIVQALRRVKTMNPVIMLDEIDKLTSSAHGDPSSALLEVLDPEQNAAFCDNYIEIPIDLSQVLFITTANALDMIKPALRDRMEVIEIPGYTAIDKHHIAVDHLVPKLLDAHGILPTQLAFKDDALDQLIAMYTHEAGVRQLEQRLSSVMRKVAVTIADARGTQKRLPKTMVCKKHLEKYLGKPRYNHEKAQKYPLSGVSTGLAWTSAGGEILMIETTIVPGTGKIVITGNLGDVMKESVSTVMTVIRSRAAKYDIAKETFEKNDIHVHFPAAATPKDGPSAGTAIFCALLSLLTDKIVPADLAMTGELSLRGRVLPIGGLREKILGAHRAGIKTVLFPKANLRDLDELPDEVRPDFVFHPVETIDEVIRLVFESMPGRKRAASKAKKTSQAHASDE